MKLKHIKKLLANKDKKSLAIVKNLPPQFFPLSNELESAGIDNSNASNSKNLTINLTQNVFLPLNNHTFFQNNTTSSLPENPNAQGGDYGALYMVFAIPAILVVLLLSIGCASTRCGRSF